MESGITNKRLRLLEEVVASIIGRGQSLLRSNISLSEYVKPFLEDDGSLTTRRVENDQKPVDNKEDDILVSLQIANAMKSLMKFPECFDDLMKDLARHGIAWCPWVVLRFVFSCKIECVFQLAKHPKTFLKYESKQPNDFATLQQSIHYIWTLQLAPFTMRRACELLLGKQCQRSRRKLAFALAKMLLSSSIPLQHGIGIPLSHILGQDTSDFIKMIQNAGPKATILSLEPATTTKFGRLTSASSVISSMSTPVPRQRTKSTEGEEFSENFYDIPSILKNSDWKVFENDELLNEEEDQVEKSNCNYVLSLAEDPTIKNSSIATPDTQQHKPSSNSVHEFIKDLNDEEENHEITIDKKQKTENGLNLLVAYLDEDDTISPTNSEAMRLLSNSLLTNETIKK